MGVGWGGGREVVIVVGQLYMAWRGRTCQLATAMDHKDTALRRAACGSREQCTHAATSLHAPKCCGRAIRHVLDADIVGMACLC